MVRKSLLEIVQDILNVMDSEDVNSIADTVEATQVAKVVETVYYEMVATRDHPEHSELVQLTSLADNDYPSHFEYPANVKAIDGIWYDVSDDGTFQYREIKPLSNKAFLKLVDGRGTTDTDNVSDKKGSTNLRIYNDRMPQYYTSFDDEYVVFDAYKSTVETTLQGSKTRTLAAKIPVFSQTDSYTPDLDEEVHPYLLSEAMSRCLSLFKGGTDPKIEQGARRQKSSRQNDMYKTKQENVRPKYGRS